MAARTFDLVAHKLDPLPPECPATLSHAADHVRVAKNMLVNGDFDQAVHDMDLAGRILLVAAAELRAKLNEGAGR